MANAPLPSPPPIDGVPALPSLRTLGTGAQQACAGDDPRLGLGSTYAAHSVTVTFTSAHMGTNRDSTVTIPTGAVVIQSIVIVTTPFSGGAAPTCAIIINGTPTTALQGTVNNDLTVAGQYAVNDQISVTNTGVVRVTLGGTAGAGAGSVLIHYVTPQV